MKFSDCVEAHLWVRLPEVHQQHICASARNHLTYCHCGPLQFHSSQACLHVITFVCVCFCAQGRKPICACVWAC